MGACPSVAMAEARLSGAAEAGLLAADASLHAHVGGAGWSWFVGAQFQGAAGAAASTVAPTLVKEMGLEATARALTLTAALSLPLQDQPAALRAELSYAVNEVFSVAVEGSGPVVAPGLPSWALWLQLQLTDTASASCGGGRDIRPSMAAVSELMLVCLASIER